MNETQKKTLKSKIINEMMTDYKSTLEKNFPVAKHLIKITQEGKVEVQFSEKLSIENKICLYLIGKAYTLEAELTSTSEASAIELMEDLGIIKGTFYPVIKRLRDKNKIDQIRRGKFTYYSIPSNLIERTLLKINKKINTN
jgi:hypothetical protein